MESSITLPAVQRCISAASIEQSAGVSQVGQAVTQMDQATQQNAALVEESAAAAESFNSQAKQLVNAVSQFKLDRPEETDRAATPTLTPQVHQSIAERRSLDRAKNFVRPSFKSAASTNDAMRATEPAPTRTGTDDWTSF